MVFLANGVAHLPVAVSDVLPNEKRVRRFSGTVYLNSPDRDADGLGVTLVRRGAALRAAPEPQVGAGAGRRHRAERRSRSPSNGSTS